MVMYPVHDQEACVTILVVEDDPPIRSIITEILEDEGYSVASATNGLEALTYIQHHLLPRLILLDLVMPVMNGWAFCVEQQRDPTLIGIPIIVMSALPDLSRTAVVLKATDWLCKPIDIGKLIGIVWRHYHAEGGRSLELGGSPAY
jgi:CheY-like chemotaxis protein